VLRSGSTKFIYQVTILYIITKTLYAEDNFFVNYI